jgi:Domain of unknown function (DUF4091)
MPHPLALAALLVVLDDGEKIARDLDHPLPPSPWPAEVSLFAMRGETVAVQAVVESKAPLRGVHATLTPFVGDAGRTLDARVDVLAEAFVHVVRPSGNAREPGSLAFTAAAAPDPKETTGWLADALVPGDAELAQAGRAALWVDVGVPSGAPPGTYTAMLHVASAEGAIGAREVRLRVLDRDMPWAAHKTMVFYEPDNLARRMGDRAAEIELRQLMHAHHVSTFRELHQPSEMDLDDRALSGELYTEGQGYDGAGQGVGEGVFAIGAYGGLRAPSKDSLAVAERFAQRLRATGRMQDTQVFLYAIDETCTSPWPGQWRELFAGSEAMKGVKVGATCGDDPVAQRADLVMMTSADYEPSRARAAKEAGKWVWAYNGQRPHAGPMMLDVPAVDLRANAWIAARYGVERWFYWESTYWFDGNRGGRGGKDGFDPFEVAETFHNGDGDWANGDGILVYPGKQITAGMRDFGLTAVFPSVRLKNLRRGVEDAAYIDMARAEDREAADAIVRRLVPSALAAAGRRASWPDRGLPWLEARAELVAIFERARPAAAPPPARRSYFAWIAFVAVALVLGLALRRRRP